MTAQERQDLVMFLEHDQLVLDKSRPVPRASLGSRATALLWALRVFAVLISAIVLYTFVAQIAG